MALPLYNSFEGGTDEVTITEANSGGASGNAFDNVTVLGATTLVYDTARAAHGSVSARFTLSGTDGAFLDWTASIGTVTEIFGRLFFYYTANPTPGELWLVAPFSGASQVGLIRLKANGFLDLFDSTLGSPIGFVSNGVPKNEWVRIEYHIICHATAGLIDCAMYHGDDSVPIERATFANANTLASLTEVNVGQYAAIATGLTFWVDDPAVMPRLGAVGRIESLGAI